jgi:hypothetical protein
MLGGFVCQEFVEWQFCYELKATQAGAGFLMRKLEIVTRPQPACPLRSCAVKFHC